MILCPLCWANRDFDSETFSTRDLINGAEVGTTPIIGRLLPQAGKVIAF